MKKNKIYWGVLSTAKIGVKKVIPAMQKGDYSVIYAIASRNYDSAKKAADTLSIPKAYGSYEELLKDKEIDAVYIPLPNHLHVEWIIKSLESGKHVLCEKPISLSYEEALRLKDQVKKFPGLKVMEAFMYRHHPQWLKIKNLIKENKIGKLRNIHSVFSYYNDNPLDIRNQADIGGGGLLDIGCYCISLARLLFNDEPLKVSGTVEYDPKLLIDRLSSGVLEFNNGTATFTCSTQLFYHQHAEINGTEGRIVVEIPFTPFPDDQSKVILQNAAERKEFIFNTYNQYTIQGDLFSKAVLENTDLPVSIEDAVLNMKVIDGIFKSSNSGIWINF